MLAAFSLLGIGNTLMQTSVTPLLSTVVSDDELSSALTFGQFVKAIASFLAPIIAAWGAQFNVFGMGWYILFPFYMVIAILAVLVLGAVPIDEESPTAHQASAPPLRFCAILWYFAASSASCVM